MKTVTRVLILLLLISTSPGFAVEKEEAKPTKKKPVNLKVGDKAPLFSGIDDNNKPWKTDKLKGKKILVVYFYPADMTPGCTKQACTYRDELPKLKRKDVVIVGVSGDKVENHKHFRDEYKLNFPLLADPNGVIAKAFGVKTSDGGKFKRELDGKEILFERGITAKRWTFVIDKDWKIAYVDKKVNPIKDTANVFQVIKKLP